MMLTIKIHRQTDLELKREHPMLWESCHQHFKLSLAQERNSVLTTDRHRLTDRQVHLLSYVFAAIAKKNFLDGHPLSPTHLMVPSNLKCILNQMEHIW